MDAAISTMDTSASHSMSQTPSTTPPLFTTIYPSTSSSTKPMTCSTLSTEQHSYFSFKDVGIFEPQCPSSSEDDEQQSGADSPLIATPGTISPSFSLNLPSLSSISSLPSLFYSSSNSRTSKGSTLTTASSASNATVTTVDDHEELKKVIQDRLGKIQRPHVDHNTSHSTNPSMLLMRRSQSLRNSYARSHSAQSAGTTVPVDCGSHSPPTRHGNASCCAAISPRKRSSHPHSQTRHDSRMQEPHISPQLPSLEPVIQKRPALSPITGAAASKKHSRSLSSLLTSWFSPPLHSHSTTSLHHQHVHADADTSPSRKQPKILNDLVSDVKSRPCSPLLDVIGNSKLDVEYGTPSRPASAQSRGRRRSQRHDSERTRSSNAAVALRQLAL